MAPTYLTYEKTTCANRWWRCLYSETAIVLYLQVISIAAVLLRPGVASLAVAAVLLTVCATRQLLLWQYYGPDNIGYRLGDMVARQEEREALQGAEYHLFHYADSIASQYIRAVAEETDGDNRIDILARIVSARPRSDIDAVVARPDVVTVHLRLGDLATTSVRHTMATLRAHRFEGCRTVLLFGNLWSGSHSKTRKYQEDKSVPAIESSRAALRQVSQYCEGRGWTVYEILDRWADDDFASLCCARHLVPGMGNFSRLVAKIVSERGGSVYTATDANRINAKGRLAAPAADRRFRSPEARPTAQRSRSPPAAVL